MHPMPSDSKTQLQFSKSHLSIVAGFKQEKMFFLVIIQFQQELVNTNSVICTMEKVRLNDHTKSLPALGSVTYKIEPEITEQISCPI